MENMNLKPLWSSNLKVRIHFFSLYYLKNWMVFFLFVEGMSNDIPQIDLRKV